MGVYNCSATVEEAVRSIIDQTYPDWELVICDDCSKDDTAQKVLTLAGEMGSKLVFLQNEKNLMLAATLNRCLKHVSGEFVARMDGDDVSLPDRFEKQVAFLNAHPEFELVGTLMAPFDETGRKGTRALLEEPDKYRIRTNTPFAHATIMARSRMFEALGGYRVSPEITRCEDVDLWFRFFEAGYRGYNIQEALYLVRENSQNFSRRNIRHAMNTSRVLRRGFKALKFPLKYYPYILKPVACAVIPPSWMAGYHKKTDSKSEKGSDTDA